MNRYPQKGADMWLAALFAGHHHPPPEPTTLSAPHLPVTAAHIDQPEASEAKNGDESAADGASSLPRLCMCITDDDGGDQRYLIRRL